MKNYKLVMKLDGTDVSRTVTVPAHMDFESLHNVINKNADTPCATLALTSSGHLAKGGS